MTEALIILDLPKRTAALTPAAHELKRQALEASALIGKVDDAATNANAAEAQVEISRVLKTYEEARKAAKDPVLQLGRAIDDVIKGHVEDVKSEQLRIARLVGDFQKLEEAKRRALEQAENERLLAIERERAAAIAKAASHDEVDKIHEKFNNRVEGERVEIPAPVRAPRQVVTEDWEITVTDIWLLAKSHPTCVRIEPLNGEIKSLLKAGVKVNGVRAEKVTRSGVRIGRERPAITV